MRLLAKGCKKDDVIYYAEKAVTTEDGNVQTNVDTVLSVCLDINKKLGKELEEDKAMSDVIQKIIRRHLDAARKEGIQEGRQEGRKEGIQEGINENKECVAADMLKDGMPLDKIAKYSRLAEDAIRSLAKSLGVAVV